MSDRVLRIVRVLYLEKFPLVGARPDEAGLRLDMTMETSWNTDVYQATPQTCAKIAELTTNRHYDVVVLGNYLGAGVIKGKHIPQELRKRTVIVSNDPIQDTSGYVALGFTNFRERVKLWPYIVGLYRN